jgi:hypothetical protein
MKNAAAEGSGPVSMLVRYTPRPGSEDALIALVRAHWPTLRKLGLATSTPPRLFRGVDKRTNRVSVFELFEWTDSSSSETAHQTPDVMAVWEPMGPLLEDMDLVRLERL